MRILHTEASCGWGGQEIRILEESRGLIDRGHDVSLVCPSHSRIAEEALRYSVAVTPMPIEFKTFAGFFAMRRHIRNNKFDVINTHSSSDSWLVALACATLSTPPAIVRTRHISAPVSGNQPTRWLYRRASHVVTTGEALRRHLIEVLDLNPEYVTSVPTGIDPSRFFPAADKLAAKRAVGLDPTHRHIGIVATLRSWKGHLYLLEAFAQLAYPDVHLVIVGEGPMREQIAEKIKALGLADRVVLVGQKTDPERWLQALDVFCLPSYANEGVPQAILQAMLCALPIVTTPVGAIPEAVSHGETALIVRPRDAQALSAGIIRMLEDPTAASALGSAARRLASVDFSSQTMLDSMDSVFAAASRG